MRSVGCVVLVTMLGTPLAAPCQQPVSLEPVAVKIGAIGKNGTLGASAAVALGLTSSFTAVPTKFKGFKNTKGTIWHWRCDVLPDGAGIVLTYWRDGSGQRTFFRTDMSGTWIRAITASHTENIRQLAISEATVNMFNTEKHWWLTFATTGEKEERPTIEAPPI